MGLLSKINDGRGWDHMVCDTFLQFFFLFSYFFCAFSKSLEPEDETLRAEIEKLIIKTPLKGDSMIKSTPFTSADMVLIIVLTRKVKHWKNKLLKKEHNFVFDIRNLTHKLREQIKLTA